ncbi:PPOX class F420-dependent oxidoreductase [Tengunoibacter tsumagoiensis]|uniref:Pyridoxamine 5'-phosphate oxidase N-terminal domain-containing protein n=1 Tax=Tengunoibacter tsumagoiensis TaxID=2014871 RepID=A0A402A4T9_9CHLR|nr:PPOX class F420-dependent oxidoreductase [Tengunoibacter tsumagoiensis]GCE14021.1 hypothetical protein KTT_38800 [Tengunoibacter tsumagoiensis]
MPTFSTMFQSLLAAEYLNLTTFRKDGRAVPTPVWFAEANGVLYVETGKEYGKVKRIRHTARVTLAPCTVRGKVTGPLFSGEARLVTTTAEVFVAKGAMQRKYGWKRSLYYFASELFAIFSRKASDDFAYLAIHPSLSQQE